MTWLPVAFVCFFGNKCAFFQGNISISIEQCQVQNEFAKAFLEKDKKVEAFQVDCLVVELKNTDSL